MSGEGRITPRQWRRGQTVRRDGRPRARPGDCARRPPGRMTLPVTLLFAEAAPYSMGLCPQRERQAFTPDLAPGADSLRLYRLGMDRPDNEIGKNTSGSADRQATSERAVLPATNSPENQRPVHDMATASAHRQPSTSSRPAGFVSHPASRPPEGVVPICLSASRMCRGWTRSARP
jgi:hypothetical protein